MKSIRKFLVTGAALALLVAVPKVVFADGCSPGQPCWEKRVKKAPPPVGMQKETMSSKPAPAAPAKVEQTVSEDKFSVGIGGTVYMLDCESPKFAPGVRASYRFADIPFNIRTGLDGTHFHAAQYEFANPDPYEGRRPRVNFFRIPFDFEYVLPVSEEGGIFLGGGPDIIHTNAQGSDTGVGGHLGARYEHALTESLAVSVDGGYLWADQEQDEADLDVDSAYVGSYLNMTF